MSDRSPSTATDDTPRPPSSAWRRRFETELDGLEHVALAALLARAFPTVRAFADGQSWTGARPELRVVGERAGGERPVAHAGIIRRFLRMPEAGRSVLVGDIGLVAVDADQQGRRLGTALMDTVATTLAELGVPWGFLTCSPALRPFYQRCGWTALHDQPLCAVTIDHRIDHRRTNGMLLPVLAPIGQWPAGPIHRDGQEI